MDIKSKKIEINEGADKNKGGDADQQHLKCVEVFVLFTEYKQKQKWPDHFYDRDKSLVDDHDDSCTSLPLRTMPVMLPDALHVLFFE